MAKDTPITHPGIVESVSDGRIRVRIMAQSACSSCHAKGMCSIAEMEEKLIDIPESNGSGCRKGDTVVISMRKSLGPKAVLLGYVVPFLLVLIVLVVLVSLTGREGLAALVSLGILVPYYLVLYRFKDRLSREFTFHILK